MNFPTYKNLKSYQQAVVICDITVEFCKKYLSPKSRTIDQMEQAARSGKQNIVEGCAASTHNPETEIKLLGVARASFEELLEDYHDFLRQHKLPIWEKDELKALALRNLYKTDKSDTTYMTYESYMSDPEKIANAMITLINQTNFLLDRQIKGVKAANNKMGVLWESRHKKAARMLHEQTEKNRKFDELLNAELAKERGT